MDSVEERVQHLLELHCGDIKAAIDDFEANKLNDIDVKNFNDDVLLELRALHLWSY